MDVNGLKVNVTRKNIKHMYLKVHDGEINVSASLNISDEEIFDFVDSKRDWIIEKLSKQTIYNYNPGEKHYLWGKQYPISFASKTIFKNDIIYLNNNLDAKKALIEFYRVEIKKAIPKILEESIAIVGEKPLEWRVKNMKTRWGTCNVSKRRIWLNLQLAKKPIGCLKYVIIHELTHLKVPSHNHDFYALLNSYCSDYKKYEKILKEN